MKRTAYGNMVLQNTSILSETCDKTLQNEKVANYVSNTRTVQTKITKRNDIANI